MVLLDVDLHWCIRARVCMFIFHVCLLSYLVLSVMQDIVYKRIFNSDEDLKAHSSEVSE